MDFDEKGEGPLDKGLDKKERDFKSYYNRPPSTLFSYDQQEREIEKDGYDIEIFRGLAFNEYFTPYYKTTISPTPSNISEEMKLNWEKCWDAENELINHSVSKGLLTQGKAIFIRWLLQKIIAIGQEWEVKIKLTKAGLAYLIFEKTLKQEGDSKLRVKDSLKNIKFFHENPYEEFRKYALDFSEKDKAVIGDFPDQATIRKSEQVFTSLLYAASIWYLRIFLKERFVDQEVRECLGIPSKKRIQVLKKPWDVRYRAEKTLSKDTPPLRNYSSIYMFKELEGYRWGEDAIYSFGETLPAETPNNETKVLLDKNIFLGKFSNILLSMANNCYEDNEDGSTTIPRFSYPERESFTGRDLSKFSSSFCFCESESIILGFQKNKSLEICGQKITYERYWKNVIKGFTLLLGVKTLLQVINRNLIECRWSIYPENVWEETLKTQRHLKAVRHLLSRSRLAMTPSQISRTTYSRQKFQKYNELLGNEEIINNICKDYIELNRVLLNHLEGERERLESEKTHAIQILTLLLTPLTIVVAAADATHLLDPDKQTTLATFMKWAVKVGWVSFLAFFFLLLHRHLFIFPKLFFGEYYLGKISSIFKTFKRKFYKSIN